MTRLYIHPLPVRIWHWTNAIGFILLILTGLQIRYVGVFEIMSFRAAVSVHNTVGFVLIANYFLWLGFYLFSDKIVVYHPELSPQRYFRRAIRQLVYYGYGIFKGEPNPHHASAYRKFNPLQSMSYQLVMMVLVPFQFYTGVLLWDLYRFAGTVELLGGVRVVATAHMVGFICILAFLCVHVYLATLGRTPGAHLKAMVTGYEEMDEEAEKPQEVAKRGT
jgi:thiosulfate reductase cytochrome b subunit